MSVRFIEGAEYERRADGSYMPDVTQFDAASWMLVALHDAGYRFVKVES